MEMKEPVKSRTCGHSYSKLAIQGHIERMKHKARCPIVGCPNILKLDDLETDQDLELELRRRHRGK